MLIYYTTKQSLSKLHIWGCTVNDISSEFMWSYQNKFHRVLKSPDTLVLSPVYQCGLTLIPPWINNYIHFKGWNEIIYPVAIFDEAADVWNRIDREYTLTHISIRGPWPISGNNHLCNDQISRTMKYVGLHLSILWKHKFLMGAQIYSALTTP